MVLWGLEPMRKPAEPWDVVAPDFHLLSAFKVTVHSQLDNDTSSITHQICENNEHVTISSPFLWFTDNKDEIITQENWLKVETLQTVGPLKGATLCMFLDFTWPKDYYTHTKDFRAFRTELKNLKDWILSRFVSETLNKMQKLHY